jgi:uncharacterized protein (TIGR02145 family)
VANSAITAQYPARASNALVLATTLQPAAPFGLTSSMTTMACYGQPATLTATCGSVGAGAVYEWGTGSVLGQNLLSPSTTTTNSREITMRTSATYWALIRGVGACSATLAGAAIVTIHAEPVPVNTFAAFPSDYSASTYVSLTDTRDGKAYPVTKIGDRWVMARNLNYQEGLTWQPNAQSPSTESGHDAALIGSFWCPGGDGATVTTSTRASCDIWGALYSWETAMLLDGYGTWTEVTSKYGTSTANSSDSKVNHGRTAHSGTTIEGRGICPENWHVPTDFEWGVLLDGMESDGGTAHQTATRSSPGAYKGVDAGKRGKSSCTSWITSDTQANWYYEVAGTYTVTGTDNYNFRVLPAGNRENKDGGFFVYRGMYALFWTSSAYSDEFAWHRHFGWDDGRVFRGFPLRSRGYSIRCIRNV